MGECGGYGESLAGAERHRLSRHVHQGLALEDAEELLRGEVTVRVLGGARWHALLDNAQAGRVDEHPSVAGVTPGVVRRVCARDRFHVAHSFNKGFTSPVISRAPRW